MKIRQILLVLFFILCIPACGNKEEPAGEALQEETGEHELSEAEEEEPAFETVTFMVYMTGSDLESSAAAASNDMAEIAQSGVDLRSVNVLVFTGGAQTWHSENPEIPADANVLYRLTENGYEEVERMDLLSMGDPANLERFLSYSFEHYPADSYDLVLWDHGNGPVIGYGSDKQFEGDSLTLPEMREALGKSPFSGETKLSLIGFDACLMSSVELMCICAPYAEYMVASQEVEPSFGWNYGFISRLGKDPADEIAEEIVEAYSSYSKEYFAEKEFFQSDVTLAAVDLSYAGELEGALNALFLKASDDVSGDYNKLAAARVRTHGFGRASTGSEYDFVDLENLMEHMQERYPEQTAAVREILSKSVVAGDSTVPNSCGLSIFYPYYNKNYYKKTWKSAYAELGVLRNYEAFLSRYEQIWLGTDLKELFNDSLQLRNGKDHDTFTMQLTPEQAEQYASARFYILQRKGDKSYTRLYSSNAVTEKNGLLTAHFDGKVIYIHNNYGKRVIPVIKMWEGNGDVTEYSCTAFAFDGLYLSNTLMCEIQFAADQENGDVVVKGIYPAEETGSLTTGKREPVNPEDWTGLMFYEAMGHYLKRDDEGRILPYEDWPEAQWLKAYQLPFANGISFSFEPLYDDGEEYFIMFEVADLQDNRYSSELLPITLAEAPEEDKAEIAVTEAVWKGRDCAVLFEESGVTLELCLAEDPDTGALTWNTRLRNDNDFEVTVSLEDVLINDEISLGCRGIYLSAEGKSEELSMFPGTVRSSLMLSGPGQIEKLSCVAYMDRQDTMEHLLFGKPLLISFAEAEEEQTVHEVPVIRPEAEEVQDPYVFTLLKGEDWYLALLDVVNPATGERAFAVRTWNNSNTDMTFELSDFSINGVSYPECKETYFGDAGYTDTTVFRELDRAVLEYEKSNGPATEISCTATIWEKPKGDPEGEVTERTESCSISIPKDYHPPLVFEPALGLKVQEQVVMEDDRMKVTLLGAGYNPGRLYHWDVHFKFCVENKTEEEVPFDVNGLKVGGVFLQGINYNAVQGPVPPGKRIYADITLPSYQIEESGLRKANSLELLLRTKEEENTSGNTQDGGTWYPVILEGGSEENPDQEDGELLYEDDYVQILLSDSQIKMNSAGTGGEQIWKFTVINKTDTDLEVRGVDYLVNGERYEDYQYYFSCKVGANSKTIHTVDNYINEYAPLPSLAFRVQVLSIGAGTLYHESEEYLTVPAGE